MPAFTMELYSVLEMQPNIGLDDYPLFNEDHRDELNQKITRRYWNREIGLETIDQFVWNMRRKMHEIMPTYNQLYESAAIKYDALSTVNIESAGKSNSESAANSEADSEQEGSSGGKGITTSSTFPQTHLDTNTTGNYADGSTESDNTGTTSGKSKDKRNDSAKTTDTTSSTTKGYQGVPAALIQEYRRAIINVDLMIVDELNELFMSIFDTSDSYTNNNGIGYLR